MLGFCRPNISDLWQGWRWDDWLQGKYCYPFISLLIVFNVVCRQCLAIQTLIRSSWWRPIWQHRDLPRKNFIGRLRCMIKTARVSNWLWFTFTHLYSYSLLNAGTIELSEMIDIIGTLFEMDGIEKVNKRDFKCLANSNVSQDC